MAKEPERYVLVPELMERCGIKTRMTIDDWVRRGVLPPKRKIGPRRVGWLESELTAFMKKTAVASIAPAPRRKQPTRREPAAAERRQVA